MMFHDIHFKGVLWKIIPKLSTRYKRVCYFRFLQRLSYLASAETVRDVLLPAETTVQEKWLPAETVRVILLPAKTLGRKLNHTDSLCKKLFTEHNSLSRKQKIAVSLCRKRKLADSFIPCVIPFSPSYLEH